jgi:DNA-binding GntR family transcriptional regulator
VQEALRRLEQEGLVERNGRRSLSVVNHSDRALRELLYADLVLRAALARFAAEKITDEQIAVLGEIVEEIQAHGDAASEEDLLGLAERFDEMVLTAASSPALQRLVESTSVIGRRRRVQAVVAMRGAARPAGRRHVGAYRDLITAFEARDPDRAEQITREQLLAGQAGVKETGRRANRGD